MSAVIREFRDIIRALETHPEWREELRRYILTDDFLALPRIVRELAEAQKRTEAKVAELAEAQKRTEAKVAELAEAQKRTEAKVAELAEAQKRTEAIVAELAEAQKRTEESLQTLRGRFEGHQLEEYCRQHPYLFARLVRRPVVLSPSEVSDLVEDAVDAGLLTEEEAYLLAQTDIIVRGYHRRENTPVYLAVEVSARVDTDDVARAVQRRNLLRQVGHFALSVVVGQSVHALAEGIARANEVNFITVESN